MYENYTECMMVEDFKKNLVKIRNIPARLFTKSFCKKMIKIIGHDKFTEKNNHGFINLIPEKILTDKLKKYAVKCDGEFLKYIDQTEELCLEAIRRYPWTIKYAKIQTMQICHDAISQYKNAILHVVNKTSFLCTMSCLIHGTGLEYLDDPDYKLCLKIVNKNPYAIEHVPKKLLDEKIIYCALQKCGKTLQFIENPTKDMCMTAIKQHGSAIRYVKNQTRKMCLIAIKHEHGFKYLHNYDDEEICLQAIKLYSPNIQYIPYQTTELCMLALQDSRKCILRYIREQTYDICKQAVTYNPNNISYVKNQLYDLCVIALEKEPQTLGYIKEQYHELCEYAQHKNNRVIIMTRNPTYEMSVYAVKKDPEYITSIPPEHVTYEMYKDAIEEQPQLISSHKYKYLQTYELAMNAVKKNGIYLQHIRSDLKDYNMCMEALMNNISATRYIDGFVDDDMYMEIIKKYSNALKYIYPQPYDICEFAYHRNNKNIKYITNDEWKLSKNIYN